MKPSSFIRIAGLFVWGAVPMPLSNAMAQPNTVAPAPTLPLIVRPDISVVASKDGLTMTLKVANGSVSSTLNEIVTRGNLEVSTRGKIEGKATLSTVGAPEDVLQAFCKAANLSCRKVAGVWVIGESVYIPVAPIEQQLTLNFQDVAVRDLIEILTRQFYLNTQVSPEVKGNIALIRLSALSPRQALMQVAVAADLDVAEKDNMLIFSPQKPKAG